MPFQRLLLLLPCANVENLKLDRPADEAEQILAGWTALWHPALLHGCPATPQWLPAPLAPRDLSGDLLVLPECARPLLPEGWLNGLPPEAVVLQNFHGQADLIAAALQRLEPSACEIDPDLATDFLALGYAHFVVEMLTRRRRSMSNLDATAFRGAVVEAAVAAALGDAPAARKSLQTAFDRLHDAREYFFLSDPKLLDLTLTAPTTLGEKFLQEFQADVPHNLLLGGETLEKLAAENPPALVLLRSKLENSQAALLGGEYAETRLPLLPPDAIAEQIRRGLETSELHLGRRPEIYARRSFGLTPALPQILEKYGFSAALHFTLDDGRFPAGQQSRIQWQGFDESAVECVASIPLDAGKPETFLQLPDQLGKTLERDHAPTVIFAHWPGGAAPWYALLRRIASFCSVLGEFHLMPEYFDQTRMAGQRAHYRADQYRSPYLVQDVEAGLSDPVSHSVKFYRQWLSAENQAAFHAWKQLVTGRPSSPPDDNSANRLAEALGARLGAAGTAAKTIPAGYLLLNPWSFSHRGGAVLPDLASAPALDEAVRAADAQSAVADLPGAGFIWLGPLPKGEGQGASDTAGVRAESPQNPPHPNPLPKGEGTSKKSGWFFAKKKSEPPLAESCLLRNEFFELRFDPQTGAIRSVSDYKSRHPRLAQQLALRTAQDGDPGGDRCYSLMVLDEMRVASPGPVFGELLCRGRLMDHDGGIVASYQQITRVWRGSRVFELEIEIDPYRLPDGNPWDSYYACRFAWSDETWELARSVNWAARPTESEQLEAPLFIDVRRDEQRTTLLTAGLPYHRRRGLRKIDSLLIVRGETARSFRLGVGIDLPNPTTAALSFLAPPIAVPCSAPPPKPSGWLFHLDHRNVIATHWEPLWEEDSGVRVQDSGVSNPQSLIPNPSSLLRGFRVRLLETEGRPAQLALRCFRPIASAEKREAGGLPPSHLNVEDDRVLIPIGPYQWFDVEARFIQD
jgi:alpha-mannosidase